MTMVEYQVATITTRLMIRTMIVMVQATKEGMVRNGLLLLQSLDRELKQQLLISSSRCGVTIHRRFWDRILPSRTTIS